MKFFQLGILSAALACAQWNPQSVPTTTLTYSTQAKTGGPLTFGTTAGMVGPNSVFNGDPYSNNYGQTIILMGQEAFCVNQVIGNMVYGERGCQGTATANHNAGDSVYYGPPQAFVQIQPGSIGQACSANQYPWTPVIVLPSAQVWGCVDGFWVLESGPVSLKKPQSSMWYAKVWVFLKKEAKAFAGTFKN